jgi:hypothetical protein
MAEIKIEGPTVGQFLEFLRQFPVDAPLRIEDPDTEDEIFIIHAEVDEKDGTVWLTGYYEEMGDRRERYIEK